jgi:hypothetical protein
VDKNILLIAYKFPPFPGIGGRRWAKFAKYLTYKGYTVHVICAKNNLKQESLWKEDVLENPRIKLYPLPSNYPSILFSAPINFLDKILYKISLQVFRLVYKGNINDKSIFWKSSMLRQADEIITKYNIKNVIATGAPFRVLYYASLLKIKYQGINLLIDIRDPWTWGEGYGIKYLSIKNLRYEKWIQDEVIKNADIVYVPVEIMRDNLLKEYGNFKEKFKLLSHAFDIEELPTEKNKVEKKNESVTTILFYGTIYENLEEIFKELTATIKEMKLNVVIDVFSNDKYNYSLHSDNNQAERKIVNYYSSMPSRSFFRKFHGYDYVLMIHPDYGKDNLSTKFYEVIYMKKPIIYIGSEGKAAKFIRDNHLGFHLIKDEIRGNFSGIIEKKEQLIYNYDFDLSSYSFEYLTDKLIENFKE